jgi:hypothetical protein
MEARHPWHHISYPDPPLPDVNECALGTHTCHAKATCTDTDGGFNCTCVPGYKGNGISCVGERARAPQLPA